MRVLLVDDHDRYRAAVRALFESAGLEVAGEASDGPTAVELARRGAFDVVAIDMHLPGLDGVEAVRRIVTAPGAPVVVAVSMDDDEALVEAAMRAGATQFIAKGADPYALIAAVLDAAPRREGSGDSRS